jgi:hypothetical protein
LAFWNGTGWVPEVSTSTEPIRKRLSHLSATAYSLIVAVALVIPLTGLASASNSPVLSVAPGAGPVGSSVTVQGNNFPSRIKVQLTWDAATTGLPLVNVDRRGAFSVVVRVPASADGSHVLGTVSAGIRSGGAKAAAALSATPLATATFVVGPAPAATPTPTPAPTATPTAAPTATAKPTATPTVAPTATPTVAPTVAPTATPTIAPTATPTAAPTATPTIAPTATPTAAPTATPTPAPTATPVLGNFPVDTTLRALTIPTLARPGYLAPLVDATLGTSTTRISNSAGVRQNYSRISAWNSDGSKILLGFTYPGRMLNGSTYADLGAFYQISGAVWSNTDPNKLFGVDSQGNGNRIYAQNATSGALTALYSFSAYSYVTIGDGEGGVSDDDHYIVLFGYPSSGGKHIIVFDLLARTVVADTLAPTGTDNAQISHHGNYVVVVGADTRRYLRNLTSSIQLDPYGNHGDNALDAAGNEIYVTNNAPGVKSYRLADGAATLLLGGGTAFEYGHTSGRNFNRPGWVYLSVYDNTVTAGRPGRDQVVAVKTDGSGTVEVFAFTHHTDNTTYADQPHGVPSPDGKRVLFASEWGGAGVFAYVAGR